MSIVATTSPFGAYRNMYRRPGKSRSRDGLGIPPARCRIAGKRHHTEDGKGEAPAVGRAHVVLWALDRRRLIARRIGSKSRPRNSRRTRAMPVIVAYGDSNTWGSIPGEAS